MRKGGIDQRKIESRRTRSPGNSPGYLPHDSRKKVSYAKPRAFVDPGAAINRRIAGSAPRKKDNRRERGSAASPARGTMPSLSLSESVATVREMYARSCGARGFADKLADVGAALPPPRPVSFGVLRIARHDAMFRSVKDLQDLSLQGSGMSPRLRGEAAASGARARPATAADDWKRAHAHELSTSPPASPSRRRLPRATSQAVKVSSHASVKPEHAPWRSAARPPQRARLYRSNSRTVASSGAAAPQDVRSPAHPPAHPPARPPARPH